MKLLVLIIAALVLLAIGALAVFVFVIQNVETPDYVTVERDGAFEIRDYPSLVVAEAIGSGSRREALSAGFGMLARYIFARERGGGKIAMTAPVIQQRSESIAMTAPVTQSRAPDGEWVVRFILPAEYGLGQLPAPVNPDVRLKEMSAQRRAAVRFSGSTKDAALAEREAALRDWMVARGLDAAGPAVYAYYNDPFTPGFLRRNEVLIDIAVQVTEAKTPPD
ncbi:MAG: heme-binding protein [Thiocapsa sp.]|jgi:hypothetical protein|nr:heme-binding protein [Thiocapsa sp.]MCG6896429.1 heme-binding protein [Thiocapsa sp.]MCG6984342.1 heme-binding protein [Thiocapsa sp.]